MRTTTSTPNDSAARNDLAFGGPQAQDQSPPNARGQADPNDCECDDCDCPVCYPGCC